MESKVKIQLLGNVMSKFKVIHKAKIVAGIEILGPDGENESSKIRQSFGAAASDLAEICSSRLWDK